MAETLLGLDVGDARIGLARADGERPLAFGRGALERRGGARDVEAVVRAAEAEGATLVVVGLPLRTDGTDSEQTRRVRAFAESLTRAGLTVAFEDERFTTRVAHRRLLDAPLGRARRRERGRVDEASAVAILESFVTRRLAEEAP